MLSRNQLLTLILRLVHSAHLLQTVRRSNGPRIAISQAIPYTYKAYDQKGWSKVAGIERAQEKGDGHQLCEGKSSGSLFKHLVITRNSLKLRKREDQFSVVSRP
jgi:hypothetical protein